jgi:Uma2 family endonuclease
MTISTSITTYKFSVDEYHRMAQAGIFHEDDHVELIEGEIVRMAPIGSRHIGVVNSLTRAFSTLLTNGRAVVSVQNPVIVADATEPEPDLVLLRFVEDNYRSRKPEARDILLLIEVADTSLDFDRLTKIPLYAGAGIAEVWLVDLTDNQIEVYSAPAGGAFSGEQIYARGATLSPLAFPDLRIRVEDIIG